MAVVLVINDDQDMLSLYDAVIRDMGHRPVTKIQVDSAAAIVREVGADALIVDLQSPWDAESGLRLIREVRQDEEIARIPIILCTGAAQEVEPLLRRRRLRDIPVIAKPFAVTDLQAALHAVLAPRAGARDESG
jgi:DNA-binding NtrC family response regulator